METKATLCAPVLEVLDKDNYLDWSIRVKTYLMAQDLWDILDELATENLKDGDDEATCRTWSKKNSMALHVIQNSCGPDSFYHIRKITSAKLAWDTLAQKYKVPENTSSVLRQLDFEELDEDKYVSWSATVKTYLMARDLWDIVEATTKPPKEEDEDLFQAWSKKNSLALHVIQNSCGPDTFSKIREKSLAKAAWDTLAKEYKTPKNTNSVVRDVLDKDNFEDWSARMKTYLMAQDLWKVVETEPPNKEEDEGAFKVWRKKNSIALKAIQNSCESNIFSEIKKIRLAKTSWDTLAKKYYNAPNGSDKKLKADLYKAVASGRWKSVKDILDNQRELVRAKITSMGETALHIAVAFGHDHTVKELVNLMSTKDLEIQDDDSFTALMSAGVRGRYEQVRCMLRKNKELLAIGTHMGYLPVDMAMYFGQEDMARFLFSETPQEVLMQSNQEGMNIGAKLCVQAVASRNFDIALSLIEKDESLAYADDGEGSSPLLELASKPHAFPSGNPFVFWKQWIYKYCIRVHIVSAPMARDETLVDMSNEDHRAEHDRADRPIGSDRSSAG